MIVIDCYHYFDAAW